MNGDSEDRDALADRFVTRNLTVVADDLSTRSVSFDVLTRDGEFVTAIVLDDILERTTERTPALTRKPTAPSSTAAITPSSATGISSTAPASSLVGT